MRAPLALVVTPDGAKAYVAHEREPILTVIDTASDRVLREIPFDGPHGRSEEPLALAIDPEGRHVFLVDSRRDAILCFDTTSDTELPALPVPFGARRIAFDFTGGNRRLHVTSARDDAVLRFVESPPGTFTPQPPLALEGHRPDALLVLPDGRLLVGNRQTRDLELVDPTLAPGATTVWRAPLDRRTLDLAAHGARALVATFVPTPGAAGPTDGRNEILELDLADGSVLASHLVDLGTDYARLATSPDLLAVVASGSGTVLLVDPDTLALVERVELAPGEPLAVPVDAAFVPGAARLYALTHFRETVRPIDLSSGPPFVLEPEIALSPARAPRLPGVDLTFEDEGERLFRSVAFFNGTATTPNPVTCATCHPEGGSDGARHLSTHRQALPLFRAGRTAPYGSGGNGATLLGFTTAAFSAHGVVGGTIPEGAAARVARFCAALAPPRSPFRESDGSLSPIAQAGRAVFENAGCAVCHADGAFLPLPPVPRNIPGGVGTGLAPANVPTLLGLWATGPYLHDHAAATLADVIGAANPFDQHGVTSGLTPTEIAQLVRYLESL